MSLQTLTEKLLDMDETLRADFLGLAEHIGIDPEDALADAINHWVGQNAPIFDYAYGTDLQKTQETKCPTPKN